MRVGLYFGSFNPIHHGHLIIASHILDNSGLQKIWFVVSPQNPLKPSNTLLNEYSRLHLVQIAVEKDDRFRASDIEFALPKPSYTSHTLAYLAEKYPSYSFSIIMGSDSLRNLKQWKNSDAIINGYSIYVYRRPGYDIPKDHSANIKILEAPLLEISATHIRQNILAGKSIKYLVPETVEEEIEKSGFYKTAQKK